MNHPALLVLAALAYLVTRSPRRNPRRRRPGDAGQLALPEAPTAYPEYVVAGGTKLRPSDRKPAGFHVLVRWRGVPSTDPRWYHDTADGRERSYDDAKRRARELAADNGGRAVDGAAERYRRPYTQALPNPAPKPPTRRQRWLVDATTAGYENDARLWARTLAEARINRADLNVAYMRGARARDAELRRNPSPLERRYQYSRDRDTQALLRSISDGELRLRSRVDSLGRRIPAAELEAIRQTVARGRRRLARRRNIDAFTGAGGIIHPIRGSKGYDAEVEQVQKEIKARGDQAERYAGIERETEHAISGGVDRPPWAGGVTNAALERFARDNGENARSPGWWERAGLYRHNEPESRRVPQYDKEGEIVGYKTVRERAKGRDRGELEDVLTYLRQDKRGSAADRVASQDRSALRDKRGKRPRLTKDERAELAAPGSSLPW